MVKYFTSEEISMHNSGDDCWIIIFENVYNITRLIEENQGELATPLIRNAGKAISHWFNSKTGDPKTFVDPERNITAPYTPEGRFIHIPPTEPSLWSTSYDLPWWKDPQYIIGKLTAKKRLIKIMNMLSRTEDVLYICEEETIADIRDRYLEYNKHASSYTWKRLVDGNFVKLQMDATLEANGLRDESEEFYKLGMDEDLYLTTLHIYFDDDLTVA